MLAGWRGYFLVFVVALGLGLLGGYEAYRPKVVVETPAPAVRQHDSSLVLQRAPDATAKPAQQIPKGATVERVVHVEVQPRAAAPVDSGAMKQNLEAKGRDSLSIVQARSAPVGPVPTLCPPVGVDLTLIKLKDGTQRVVASSRDGIVLDSVSIDRPVVPDVIPKVLVWDAGAVYGSVAQWGGYVGRQIGPAHLALAGLPAKGREPARAMLMIGLRF